MRNRIEVAGYLADKPGRRYLGSGTPVANARLGETYGFRDRDGQMKQQTNWHALSFYGDLADTAMTFEKGDHVFIEGTVEQREFTPKDGSARMVHEIIVRSCHLIAPPRRRGKPAETDKPVEQSAHAAGDQKGAADAWPVQ